MAIDTRAKRQHVAGIQGALGPGLLPNPDGTVAAVDRSYFGSTYFEADAPEEAPAWSPITVVAKPNSNSRGRGMFNTVGGNVRSVAGNFRSR